MRSTHQRFFLKLYFSVPKINIFGVKSQKLKIFFCNTTWKLVFNGLKRLPRYSWSLCVLTDEKHMRSKHQRIFWNMFFWDPKYTNLEQTVKNWEKNHFLQYAKLVFDGHKRTLRCSWSLRALTDEKWVRSIHQRIFWKNYILGPKINKFGAKFEKIEKIHLP